MAPDDERETCPRWGLPCLWYCALDETKQPLINWQDCGRSRLLGPIFHAVVPGRDGVLIAQIPADATALGRCGVCGAWCMTVCRLCKGILCDPCLDEAIGQDLAHACQDLPQRPD